QEGLERVETLSPGHQIRRLGQDRMRRSGLLAKVGLTLSWSYQVIQEYRNRPISCINCHSVPVLPVSVLLKYLTGAKLVYDAHELETETNGLSGLRQWLTRGIERWMIRYVDYSIFVGKEIDRWYRRTYGLKHTAVIYNCPQTTTVEATDCFRERFGISPETPIFLYQGVLAAGRGLDPLIEAFTRLAQEAALVIMGFGPGEDRVRAALAECEAAYFHPAVPPDALLEYTAAADFGLSLIEPTSLSYELCMPNKLFEYLMAGKPVVVSPTREQRDFVVEHQVGVVARDLSVAAIVDAVRAILASDAGEMQRAVSRTRALYSWETQESELRKVYSTIGFPVDREEVV
ncbi:MAG: glycosyltransferase, partial [Pseudomonadales bacterium]|nr:glycosyltransferase [Pseudomonadales bacterium]